MKICSLGAELFNAYRRTDRPTDMTKLIAGFRNSANAPETNHTNRRNIVTVYSHL